MIDHLTLTVRDLQKSIAFYKQALAPLGYRVKMDYKEFVGFGDDRKPYFWLRTGPTPTQPMHLAFMAHERAKVDAFYAAALKAGAQDNGPPGPREQYHPSYYGAFVLDPDGHPIEACCHLSPPPAKAAAGGKVKVKAKSAPAKRKTAAKGSKKPAKRAGR
jgi:catechol 2,3-dioxygenase-like lactoylglutathione lyase family enzyme